MIIVHNKILPFGSYVAITIGPFILTKRKDLNEVTINHESIHWAQEKETLIIGFYLLYVLMFLWEFVRCLCDSKHGKIDGYTWRNSTWKRAYRSILFEREAYNNEKNEEYIKNRRHYAWLKV